MRLFAKLILLIYGLSIAGYVLLDAVHEVLHQFKNNIHHHEHDHHHAHDHHHVEDHHGASALEEDENTSLVIYYFHLFFQRIAKQELPVAFDHEGGESTLVIFESLTFPPSTPPPMFFS